jgi:hypothetical protein
LLIIGFAMMSGGGAADSASFSPQLFSTRRIVVAPVITTIGFALVVAGILYKPKAKKSEEA